MQRHKFTTITEFIAAAPKPAQSSLKKIRATLKAALPKAEQTISYNIPCFKLNGKYVIYFAGYEKHVSVYPIPKNPGTLKADIEKYKAGKGTLRFPLDKPLPVTFIKKVALLLAKLNK